MELERLAGLAHVPGPLQRPGCIAVRDKSSRAGALGSKACTFFNNCQDNNAIYEGNSKFSSMASTQLNVKDLVLKSESGSDRLSVIITH